MNWIALEIVILSSEYKNLHQQAKKTFHLKISILKIKMTHIQPTNFSNLKLFPNRAGLDGIKSLKGSFFEKERRNDSSNF